MGKRIERRLAGRRIDQGKPMFAASNIHVKLSDRIRGIGAGGRRRPIERLG
jgi:hypothetical protein